MYLVTTSNTIKVIFMNIFYDANKIYEAGTKAIQGAPFKYQSQLFEMNHLIETAQILKDLKEANFVGKIKDVGKGAKKRLEKGLPQEYLYVFKYPCELRRRDADDSGIVKEKLIIYIKINNRKIPYKKVFIVSFHKNRVK